MSESDEKYLEQNWKDMKTWDGLTDEEKMRIFRSESKKKRSITDNIINDFIRRKKK